MKKNNTAPDGLILLHKRPGVTSFDALRDIKRLLGSGRVGHTGTLDKFAEGLLLVLTGRALKLSRWFTHCDKQYEGTIRFGAETDTLDPEGSVIAGAPLPSREAVEQALSRFTGEIEQAPPAYSAIHIDGERSSNLARRGEAVEMKKRPVTIYRLKLLSWEPPDARIFVHCSGGTYIRSLSRDIALAAGSRAHVTALVRTRVALFRLEDAVLMNSEQGTGVLRGCPPLRGGAEKQSFAAGGEASPLLPIDKNVFEKLGIPCIDISGEDAQKVVQGKPLAKILQNTSLPRENPAAALFADGEFIAMLEFTNNIWNYGYVYARN